MIQMTLAAVTARVRADRMKLAELEEQNKTLRRKLKQRAGDIRAMDPGDLLKAKNVGVLPKHVVEEEIKRRREAVNKVDTRVHSVELGNGAAIGGQMPCAHSGCDRVVELAKRPSGRCAEHEQDAPRVVMTSGMGGLNVYNLDSQLEDAERRLARARAEFDQERAEVESLRKQITDYDAKRGRSSHE
jgi:hypothetical protein